MWGNVPEWATAGGVVVFTVLMGVRDRQLTRRVERLERILYRPEKTRAQ